MGLREELWVIAAAIYVLGMFPLFYFYQISPSERFSAFNQSLTYISLFGAIVLLFLFMAIGAWGKGTKDEDL